MSWNSSSHEISVGSGSSNVVSLAVLSSSTFFSVSSNVEYDTNHTVLLNFKWFLGGEIESVWWFNLVCLICGDEERLIFKFLNGFFFLIWTNRAQSLYLVTVFPSSVHRFFFLPILLLFYRSFDVFLTIAICIYLCFAGEVVFRFLAFGFISHTTRISNNTSFLCKRLVVKK